MQRNRSIDRLLGLVILACLVSLVVLFFTPFAADAQPNTVTLTPSVTQGDGQITTQLTWSTSPALSGAAPCTASGHPDWSGPKAGAGGPVAITIATSGTLPLTLTCQFGGDSLAEMRWTPATENTDGSAYTNRGVTRIKYTFAASLISGPDCAPGGVEVCATLDDRGSQRPSVHTFTGITQTGAMRARAWHQSSTGVWSDNSNVVTKTFTGSVAVTQSVSITVNPKPAPPGGLEGT